MLCTLLRMYLIWTYLEIACSRQFRSDYEYFTNVNGWFKLHLIPATWRDAFKICDAEGAVLASPTNANMKSIMATNLAKKTKIQCPVFTGVHSLFSKGFYSSIEGIPLAKMPLKWAIDEPNNADNNEDCIIFLKDGTIADANCTDVFPYMCFKKQSENMVITPCGTIDEEYTFSSFTRNCYKFHGEGKTWKDVYMTCEAEGAHLAIIDSNEEAQFIKDLSSCKIDTVSHDGNKNIILLGVHDWGDHGNWRTIHGTKLKDSGYSEWNPGQPDNKAPGQHCGAMLRHSKKLDDYWCDVKACFVCEKSPESLIDNNYYNVVNILGK